MAKQLKKAKAKDVNRRRKKKVSVLTQESIGYVDWKDINLLRRFMSDRAKIRARQVTGNNQQQQTEIARAIKNAREMALLPYNNRITTQRSSSRTRDDNRVDGPAPQPTAPPPGIRTPAGVDGDDPETPVVDDPTSEALTPDVPVPELGAEVVPDAAVPELGAEVVPDAAVPELGAEVVPDAAAPELGAEAEVVPDAAVPGLVSEDEVVPDAALPESAGEAEDEPTPEVAS